MKAWGKNINNSIKSLIAARYEEYKSYERFKFVKDIIKKRIGNKGEFLDIGCSKGEFIWYLKDFFSSIRFTGIDISQELISLAKKEPKLNDATFIKTDVQNFNLNKKFDFVLMSGVLSIFDDFKQVLRQMIKHLKPCGRGYIFGYFNEEDIDVLVRYRNNYLGSKNWESGLNMISLKTITKELRCFADEIRFHKFKLSIDLPKNEDPMRSYTLNTVEKGKIVVNGANIINQFYLIEFMKKK